MRTVSKVPAVVDALVEAIRAQRPGLQVLDGPEVTEEEGDSVTIGISDGQGVPAYAATQTKAQGLGNRAQETFTIYCWLRSWTGDTGPGAVKERRDAAAHLLAGVDEACATDAALKAVCTRVQLGEALDWTSSSNEAGTMVGVLFDITGTALL